MVANIHGSPRRGSGGFQRVADAFLARKGLPFAEILSAERIERVFAQHGGLFGLYGIYSVAVMVWSFLSQVLRDGKEASCQAAVARVVSHCQQVGIAAPTSDTGDYCRARAKLVEAALHALSCDVAVGLELAADKAWLWKKRFHAKLIDGFTFTMPGTPKNQARYPQSTAQKPGVGLPIARVVAILSLATACVTDLALGPYKGKETGETALLRALLRSFVRGDIAVADRYYCSFMMIALLLRQGVQTCAQRSAASLRLSPWPAAGQVRSSHHVDATGVSGVDGRGHVLRRSLKRSHSARSAITSSFPVGARGRSISSRRCLMPTRSRNKTSRIYMASGGMRNWISAASRLR